MSTIETLSSLPLLPATLNNLKPWLDDPYAPEWTRASIIELVEVEAWDELNDRFHRELEFGTGGIRGRTIGRRVTAAEAGGSGPEAAPRHAAVGSNLLNEFTVRRAAIGLFRFTAAHLRRRGQRAVPRLVLAHDVRHYSAIFCRLIADTWAGFGGGAFVFDGPRPTPQLSYTVRYLRAHFGIMITASHNPPHDNGLKIYFEDGAQVVPPVADGIVDEIRRTPLSQTFAGPEEGGGRVVVIQRETEEAYGRAILQSVVRPNHFQGDGLRVAFSALHGTGGVVAVPSMRRLGIEVIEVESQRAADPDFPTVPSPNPENDRALSQVLALAWRKQADLALATDPDGDRIGVAAPDAWGDFVALTGNQIGALLADFRLSRLKEAGLIPPRGSDRVALIKTLVTSRLIDAIARDHGVKAVNTLTGFKWIAARLRQYDEILLRALHRDNLPAPDLLTLPLSRRAELFQNYSAWFVLGTEESYGYLPIDVVRDKDANAAALALAEMAAHAKNRGTTLPGMLEDLYIRYGYHDETVGHLAGEGAAGAARTARILASYRANPPKQVGAVKVIEWRDYGLDPQFDEDCRPMPKQDLYIAELANGYRVATRAIGTEAKLKFYLFAREPATHRDNLPALRTQVCAALAEMRVAWVADAERRGD